MMIFILALPAKLKKASFKSGFWKEQKNFFFFFFFH